MPRAFGLFGGLAKRPNTVNASAAEFRSGSPALHVVDVNPRSVKTFIGGLVEAGQLEPSSESRALAALKQTISGTDCSILTELGLIEEADLIAALATFHDTRITMFDDLPPGLLALEGVPKQFWERARIVPLRKGVDGLTVAMVDPFEREKLDALRHLLDGPVQATIIGHSVFENAFRTLYGDEAADHLPTDTAATELDDLARLQDVASQAPIIRLGARLLKTAFELNASDIHIEPQENDVRVRYRVDGVLVQSEILPKSVQMALTTRFKILAGLNIAELRMPQDGRMKVVDRGAATDLRVAALPTANGESLVMRILRQSRRVGTLSSLGFSDRAEAQLKTMIARPNGIVLVSGPTGSGKTTTLYTALSMLNGTDRKIITVEDPVEYRIAGVSQVQTHAQIGLDFAAALRSILRQDPDIVMIGEIRDQETARIAVQAALTGHLVLSTIHTNSAAATITRLVEMGVERYLIAATLNGVVAQRLVRLVCPACAEEVANPRRPRRLPSVSTARGSRPKPALQARGCPQCNETGYRGRSVVGEVLTVDQNLRDLIVEGSNASVIEAHAVKAGMDTLAESALDKVRRRETTIDEVLRHVDLSHTKAEVA